MDVMEMHMGLIHFPIALFVGAGVLEIWGRIVGKETIRTSSRHVLILGILFAIPTVVTGLLSSDHIPKAAFAEMAIHRLCALTTFSIALALAIWLNSVKKFPSGAVSGIYAILIIVLALLVLYTGWLGGQVADKVESGSEEQAISMPSDSENTTKTPSAENKNHENAEEGGPVHEHY